MGEYSLVIAFSIGLMSTLHCLGMCSGIIGALSFSLPPQVRSSNRRMFPYLLGYNFGRITSYTLAGLLLGGISHNIFSNISPKTGHFILETGSAVILLFIGFHIAGWFPKLNVLEKIGRPIWRYIEPYGRRMLPVKTPVQALGFGAIWGWLPCGLVYTTLIWAASSGESEESAILMLAFGLGTLPTTLLAGFLSGWLAKIGKNKDLKKIAGGIIITIALVSLYFILNPNAHELIHWGAMKTHDHQ
ncbi:MAG: sulfite exporter TauE/SafE family protein [Gammaproteobacteria bacterium]|nr:sulfite exporter TauE/SafE family protein [Gammaproteobacteria bacterium]